MIHTHLLPQQPPYQIIAAGGHVGLQVATLIVTEETRGEDGAYGITTHSHPVVNYARKQLALDDNDPSLYAQNRQVEDDLSPEGAVWDKAEVRHIWVLGIEGAMKSISWFNFIHVINKNDADWSVEINDHNELWQHKLDMRRVRDTLLGLGVKVLRYKSDPVIIDLFPIWDPEDPVDEADDEGNFIVVGLGEVNLLAVRMGEVEATAQLIIEGLKNVASFIFPHHSYISVEADYNRYKHIADFTAVAERVDAELAMYENP